jgi:hypothetical protein
VLSITSTVLTGVAVVAAAVGAVLFFDTSSPAATAERASGPTLSLDLAPDAAAARARWRF